MANKHTRYVAMMRSFGKAVRYYRNKLGFSQEALADRAQLDRSYMSQIERGIKNATLNSIWRISQALEVTPSDLLNMMEEIDRASDGEALPAPESTAPENTASAKDAANITVLVVDDDEDICLAVAAMLRDAGFHSLSATSGLDAMRIVASERVDAIVSDVRMPNGNGLELLDTVRKHYPNVPVFFITGYDDLSPEDARRRGAVAIFNKPFDVRSFVSSLKSSLHMAVS
jgi:CheY-like chemotaxis protein/DNA-binding XRE family transcriptional regulator